MGKGKATDGWTAEDRRAIRLFGLYFGVLFITHVGGGVIKGYDRSKPFLALTVAFIVLLVDLVAVSMAVISIYRWFRRRRTGAGGGDSEALVVEHSGITTRGSSAMVDELGKLAALHQQGLLSDAEFASAKAAVIGAAA